MMGRERLGSWIENGRKGVVCGSLSNPGGGYMAVACTALPTLPYVWKLNKYIKSIDTERPIRRALQ